MTNRDKLTKLIADISFDITMREKEFIEIEKNIMKTLDRMQRDVDNIMERPNK